MALYGGDATHLASYSSKVRIPFSTTSTFCAVPSTGSPQPCDGFTLTSTGGATPVKWYVAADSTCDQNGNCSSLNEDTGAFVAGPTSGYVVVRAFDANQVEQFAFLTVGDVADAGPPIWGDAQAPAAACTAVLPDAGLVLSVTGACAPPGADGGPSGPDASVALEGGAPGQDGAAGPADANGDAPPAASDASEDASASGSGGGKSGCACDVVTHGGGVPVGACAGVGLGLAALVRRRRARTLHASISPRPARHPRAPGPPASPSRR